MNVLILTAKFGHGHLSAAEALKEKLLLENSENNVIIIDFIDYIFPKLNKIIYGLFNLLVNKCHTIYNLLNILAPKKNSVPLKKVVTNKIDKLLEDYKIDSIISVVPICSEYISAYKKMTGSDIPLSTCITDIEVHNSWINDLTSYYFVPSNKTKKYLITKNINPKNIIVSGIPVKSKFNKEKIKTEKRKILIMGGGLGLIPNINEFITNLNYSKNIELTIIVGNNKKLYNWLTKEYKNLKVLGFVNNVHDHMISSDLIITKAGGITTFEAIYAETPLYIIKPFLVQEKGNASFIEEEKIGKVIWKKDNNKILLDLINNEKELNIMMSNMKEIKKSINKIEFTKYLRKEEVSC